MLSNEGRTQSCGIEEDNGDFNAAESSGARKFLSFFPRM